MTTMVENVIGAGIDNRPPMLERVCITLVEENVITRPRTYEELTDKEKIHDECDIRATNIVLQGLPPDVYNLVNHHTVVKEIWDRVKLFIEGTKLLPQEHECKLYNELDMFTFEKGETIHAYYLRFSQLINDMNTIGMTVRKLQVNTKFVNNLQPKWSKFVTNVKLEKDMHESNFDQLYAYLSLNKPMAFSRTTITSRYAITHDIFQSKKPSHYSVWQGYNSERVGETKSEFCRSYGKTVYSTKKGKEFRVVKGEDAASSDIGIRDCDEAPSVRAVLMANLSSYDFYVLSKQNAMIMSVIDEMSNQVAKCNAVNLENMTVNESLNAELERYKEQIKKFKEQQKVDLNDREKYIDSQIREMIVNRNAKFAAFENEIHTLKLRLSKDKR
ncbi:hypothetical protein Tco_1171630 [Tanacetum coccineum]